MMTKLPRRDAAPAIFFDIDGVLNRDPGELGILSPDELELLPGAAAAVAKAKQAGFLAVGVTNRAQVAHGRVTLAELDGIFARLQDLLSQFGAPLDRIYFCPHHPDGSVAPFAMVCDCRKPGAQLIQQAVAELSIDLTRSALIGDSLRDIGAAHAAGIPGFGVRTGYGCVDTQRYPGGPSAAPTPDGLFDDAEAAIDHWTSSKPIL